MWGIHPQCFNVEIWTGAKKLNETLNTSFDSCSAQKSPHQHRQYLQKPLHENVTKKTKTKTISVVDPLLPWSHSLVKLCNAKLEFRLNSSWTWWCPYQLLQSAAKDSQ